MENGKLWLIKSLPISEKSIMFSKMMVNFIITAPASFISAGLLCISLKPDFMTGLYMFLTPLAYSIFVAAFGLALNLLMPKMDWTSDTQVVKQSAAVMVAIFAGMAIAGVPIALCMSFGPQLVMPITTIVVAVLGFGLIAWINHGGIRRFRQIN